MNLLLFSSTADTAFPNLVGLQHSGLAGMSTQLVCPIRQNLAFTPIRVRIRWNGMDFIVACDLIRPINTAVLKRIGELEHSTSLKILQTFQLLLASED
jgi:mRNA-degrading endonuclease toxin of MazEF toxin-antitoxin module